MANVLLCDNGGVSGVTGIKLTSDTSGALDIKVGNGSVTGLSISAAGNVGVGVTPSAWTLLKPMQIADTAFLAGQSSAESMYLGSNAYYNSGWKYLTTNTASYYSQGGGTHAWYTAPSGTAGNAITFTQAMTLDASGNLGIGTSSPGTKLDVNGNIGGGSLNVFGTGVPANGINNVTTNALGFFTNSTERARIDSSGNLSVGSTASLGRINAGASNATSYPSYSNPGAGGLNGAFIAATLNSADNYLTLVDVGGVTAQTDGVNGGSAIRFLTQPRTSPYGVVERARIDSSGNLLVGGSTLNGTGVFSVVVNNQGVGASPYLNFNKSGTGGLDQIFFKYNGTVVGKISYNDTATTYATSSDYRLKDQVQPMTGALAKVAALKPVTYKWKVDGSDGEGFIAHELQAVVPQCVTGEKDAVDAEGKPVYQGIDTSFLVATLTAAIQEQQAIINSLKARLDAAGL